MVKRFFDLFASLFSLLIFGWIIFVSFIISSLETQSCGFFFQKRIGREGIPFIIIKIKTMQIGFDGTKTVSRIGSFFRRSKIDELPQLINILVGDMSFVGPRPDVEGYYNTLQGEDRLILNLRPGLTSEASLKYFNEEKILRQVQDSKAFNDNVIFPDKVKLNLKYYYNNSLLGDVKIILQTLLKYINE